MSNAEERPKKEQAEELKEEKIAENTGTPPADPVSSGEVRLEDLKAKIIELEQSAASLKDKLLRKAAEFENYKKRIENDFATMARFANEQIIMELLPIIDDFTRSMKSAMNRPEFDSFHRGIELIHSKFLKLLEKQGVKEIETLGKTFDVYYHEALMEMPKEGVAPHTIIEEVEKGYILHDKVIRHAKVIVAGEPHHLAPQPKDDVEFLQKKQPRTEKTHNNAKDSRKEPGSQQPTDGDKADE